MKIQPIPSAALPATDSPKPQTNSPEVQIPRTDVYLRGRLADLGNAVASVPAIRPEAIALGRRLAMDPNYPGPIILEQLASYFVADATKV